MKCVAALVLIVVGLVLVLALAGGSRKEESAAPSVGAPAEKAEAERRADGQKKPSLLPEYQNPIKAPVSYLHVVTVRAPRHARKTLALSELSGQIKQFQAFEGHYPESLKELQEWRGAELPELSRGFQYKYDPKTGSLEVVEVPQE